MEYEADNVGGPSRLLIGGSSSLLENREVVLKMLSDMVEETSRHALGQRTLYSYQSIWKLFVAFCLQLGLLHLPASSETVMRFLSWYGMTRSVQTVRVANSAIKYYHHSQGFPYETSMKISAFLAGFARRFGKPQAQKDAVYTSEIKNVCDLLDREGGITAVRDKCLLLFGFAAALRASEAIGIDWSDLKISHQGFTILIRKSKTDKENAGQSVAVARTVNGSTCPVEAMEEWRSLVKGGKEHLHGRLLRSLTSVGGRGLGEVRIDESGISHGTYQKVIKERFAQIGLDPDRLGGHSLRSGHATQAAQNGASEFEIAEQGRWKSMQTVKRYVRLGTQFKNNSSRKLGL